MIIYITDDVHFVTVQFVKAQANVLVLSKRRSVALLVLSWSSAPYLAANNCEFSHWLFCLTMTISCADPGKQEPIRYQISYSSLDIRWMSLPKLI